MLCVLDIIIHHNKCFHLICILLLMYLGLPNQNPPHKPTTLLHLEPHHKLVDVRIQPLWGFPSVPNQTPSISWGPYLLVSQFLLFGLVIKMGWTYMSQFCKIHHLVLPSHKSNNSIMRGLSQLLFCHWFLMPVGYIHHHLFLFLHL